MSEHFSADWLALREPADIRARSERLVRIVSGVLPSEREIRALDLASGTGSNVRYLSPKLAQSTAQRWTLADHDAALLARARETVPVDVATRVVDFANLELAPTLFEGYDLVTASALLDLVSEAWLLAALARCQAAGAHVFFALNYDGRMECSPADADDSRVRDLVNRHQRTDKGFGPALGPDAAPTVARLLTDLGYRVERETSDWVIGADESELQRQLIEGWADAAVAIAPRDAGVIDAWRARRQRLRADSRSRLLVGHEDVVGLAPVVR